MTAAVLTVLLGWCARPAPVCAGWRDFIPTPYLNTLTLDAAATYETYQTGRGEQRQAQSELFVKEKLTFISNGFSYHPRFIHYRLLLAGALKQETYKNDEQGSVSSAGSGFDYDLRLNILPEHPYKFKVFTSRTEPLYQQYFSADAGAVSTRSGATFTFRKKPYFFNLRYIDSSRTWARGSSDLDIYGADSQYFKELSGGRNLSLAAFYDHSAARPSAGPGGSAENFGASGTIALNAATLQSSVTRNFYRQDAGTRGFDSDGLLWLERLNLQLPLHFKSLLTYRYQKHDQTIAPAGDTGEEVRSVTNQNYGLDITHKLYRSLETAYRLRRDLAATANGDTASTSHTFAADYLKSVPGGTAFAGANVSWSETDSAGSTTVANETHERLGINEVFTVLQRNADCGSIRVFLTDQAAGNRPVPVDFIAVPSPGARCDIMVIGIPPDFDQTVPHQYTISYTIESGTYTLRTDSYGYNASLSLFQSNLTPYYSRTVSSTNVVSGLYPGTPFDGEVSTVGLVLGNRPWRFLGEYQQSDGSGNSFRRWRGEAGYNQFVATATNVALTASLTRTEYPEGSTAGSPQAYTNDATRLSANFQQRFFRRSLVLSAGGTYSSFAGLMKSSGYSLHGSLQWRIGMTTITAGANGYRSRGEGLPETDRERARQYYYLNVRREIF